MQRVNFQRLLMGLILALPAWTQNISTVAGGGNAAYTSGAVATSVGFGGPLFVKADQAGNLYIWSGAMAIYKVSTSGIVTTYAGNGHAGYSGDGGPATSAMIFGNGTVQGLAVDSAGNLYFSDGENQRVRKVDTTGKVTTVAGNGTMGYSGDGGPATSAMLSFPNGLAVDSFGNLYIADEFNERVRKVDTTGKISTVAGNGSSGHYGDGGPALAAMIGECVGVAVDGAGNLYISGTFYIRKVDTAGNISTVTGTGALGYSGDGGPAAGAAGDPIGIATDAAGNLYFADANAQRVRKIDTSGMITTVAGNGKYADNGDGGPATSAAMKTPLDVSFDGAGNLYIAEAAIRKVTGEAASGGGLQVSSSALTFTYATGGAAPASQALSVSTTGAAVTFSATPSTTSGGNWLTVTPPSGSTPATLTVSIATAGLGSGTYKGSIAITLAGSATPAQTISVVLNVTGAGAPTFTASGVVNASGYQNTLAPGVVYVIFGNNLGPAAIATASGPAYPNSVGGTSITFTPTSGGAPVTSRMVYSVATQVAGQLPSSTAPGAYSAVVTYNNISSAPQTVNVAARSFGIATANSAGTGVAQATIGGGLSLTRFASGSLAFGGNTWVLTPAYPGNTVVLWGTGGGADLQNDLGGTTGDQTAAGNFIVTVDGRALTPQYAGASSGYPGLWQINFTLPSDIAPDCFASVQVTAGGNLSNNVIVPIAAIGQTACSDPQLSTAALAKLDSGGDIVLASFALSKSTSAATNTESEAAFGGVSSFNAAELAAARGPVVDGCIVSDRTALYTAPVPSAPDSYLNAGASVPVSGPGLASTFAMAQEAIPGGVLYETAIPSGTLAAGAYTINSKGGTQVGPFTATVNFPASFTVTNLASLTTIARNQPLTVNWTGGGSGGYVEIAVTTQTSVSGSSLTNDLVLHTTSFICYAPAAAGAYTVPAAVTKLLVPVQLNATGSTGLMQVNAVPDPNASNFTATLAGGGSIDIGIWGYVLGVIKSVAVQ